MKRTSKLGTTTVSLSLSLSLNVWQWMHAFACIAGLQNVQFINSYMLHFNLADGILQSMWMLLVVDSLHHFFTQSLSGISAYHWWRASTLVAISMGLSMPGLAGSFGGAKKICQKNSSSISIILELTNPPSPSTSPKVITLPYQPELSFLT